MVAYTRRLVSYSDREVFVNCTLALEVYNVAVTLWLFVPVYPPVMTAVFFIFGVLGQAPPQIAPAQLGIVEGSLKR